MAAGEDQTESIVLDLVILDLFNLVGSVVDARFHVGNKISLCSIEARAPAHSVYGLEACRRNQPWSRVAGYSTLRPQAQRRRKGFVHRLLGKIKVTEQADQSCQDSSRIHAIKGVEQFANLLG